MLIVHAELLHFQAERAAGEAEGFGGGGDVSFVGGQRLEDHAVFDRVHFGDQSRLLRLLRTHRALQRERQVVAVDDVFVDKNHRAFDDIFQLADVARPRVGEQHLLRRARDGLDLLAELPGEARYEKLRQGDDVAVAVAQWRNDDGKDVQAVIEVFAESPHRGHLHELAVRGRDDADVDFDLLVRADPLDGALLQNPQQFGLHRQRKFADFVEKDRAAIGLLEAPFPRLVGSGEGPLFVAEQLAFDDAFRQRGAVEGDKRLFGLRAVVVNRAGDQLLADAALAEDQHRRAGFDDLVDERVHLQHRLGVADDVRWVEFLPERVLEPLVLHHEAVLVLVFDQVEFDRLRDHGGDDAENLHIESEQLVVVAEPLDADRPEHLSALQNRDADEGERVILGGREASGAVEKVRLVADDRHDDPLAGFDHLAGDSLADGVDAAILLLL